MLLLSRLQEWNQLPLRRLPLKRALAAAALAVLHILHEQSALLAAVKNIPTAMVLSWQHAWTALNLQHLQSTAPMKHVPLAQAALSQPEVPDQPTGQHVCSTSLELLHDRRLSQNLSIPKVAARRFQAFSSAVWMDA